CTGLLFDEAFDRGWQGRTETSVVRTIGLQLRKLPEPVSHEMGLGQPLLGRILRSVCAAVFDGNPYRLENLLMAEYQTFEYDVLVIGAGGAGLRAAIEASAAGVPVAFICKSLFAKAPPLFPQAP